MTTSKAYVILHGSMQAKSILPFQIIQYFKEVREELTKVTWPSRQHTIEKTTLVIVVSLAVGLYIGGLDLFFTWLTKLFL